MLAWSVHPKESSACVWYKWALFISSQNVKLGKEEIAAVVKRSSNHLMIDRAVLLHFYSFSSMYLKAKEPWALGRSGERQKGWDVVGWMCIGHVWASVTPNQALIFQVWVQHYGERLDLRTCSEILLLLSQWETEQQMKLLLWASYFIMESFEGQPTGVTF